MWPVMSLDTAKRLSFSPIAAFARAAADGGASNLCMEVARTHPQLRFLALYDSDLQLLRSVDAPPMVSVAGLHVLDRRVSPDSTVYGWKIMPTVRYGAADSTVARWKAVFPGLRYLRCTLRCSSEVHALSVFSTQLHILWLDKLRGVWIQEDTEHFVGALSCFRSLRTLVLGLDRDTLFCWLVDALLIRDSRDSELRFVLKNLESFVVLPLCRNVFRKRRCACGYGLCW